MTLAVLQFTECVHCALVSDYSVLFIGRPDGELLYRLELESLDPEPASIDLMSSPLGK